MRTECGPVPSLRIPSASLGAGRVPRGHLLPQDADGRHPASLPPSHPRRPVRYTLGQSVWTMT